MIRFNLTAIPTDAIVLGASLTAEITMMPSAGAAPSNFTIHKLTAGFAEGVRWSQTPLFA